jgi:IclR family transcriptional regulator, KDG regulon repressor
MENTSGTVKKALDVLEIFLLNGGELTLNEISEKTGYNRATAFRLVSTLAQKGFLHQEIKKGKYYLSLRTLQWGYVARTRLGYLDTMYRHVSKLCREHGVSINTTVFDMDKLLVIDEIGTANDFRITAPVGKLLPLYATAAGKVILAHWSGDERKAFYARTALEPTTQFTIVDISRLEKEIEKVKKEGIAYDQEEFILGTWATAYPVYENKNILAIISIVAPSSQIDAERSKKLSAALKNCATEISFVFNRTAK